MKRWSGPFTDRKTLAKVLVLSALLAAAYCYYWQNVRGMRWYQWPYRYLNNRFTSTICPRPKEDLQGIVHLVHAAHKVFSRLGIVYAISYGTLFGALRYGGPVPWDADADIVVLKQTADKYTLKDLKPEFARYGVDVEYYNYAGMYYLRNDKAVCDCFLVTDFYGTGWLHRIGWESYIFFINYRWHHLFPAKLLKPPLPKLNFGGLQVHVPHGKYEIQKYLYRGHWDVEVRPPNCPKNITGEWLFTPPPTDTL